MAKPSGKKKETYRVTTTTRASYSDYPVHPATALKYKRTMAAIGAHDIAHPMATHDTEQSHNSLGSAFDEFMKAFFTGNALQNILFYMCNKCTIEVVDPICTTLKMFITTPVIFAVTQIGLIPFRNCPMAIFPYTHMSAQQKNTILTLLSLVQEQDSGRVSTQLGGGCRVTLARRFAHSTHLPVADVLATFCDAVLSSPYYTSKQVRVSVCNIVLQRLGVTVGLSRSIIRDVHARIMHTAKRDNDADRTVVSSSGAASTPIMMIEPDTAQNTKRIINMKKQ